MQGVIINHVHSGVFTIFSSLAHLEIEPSGTKVIGENYSLKCTATTEIPGDKFEFSWVTDAEDPIVTSDKKDELLFNRLKSSHKGTYTCKCSVKQRCGCFSGKLHSTISYYLDVTGKHHHAPIIECHVVKTVNSERLIMCV